jgi:hypothetical protein
MKYAILLLTALLPYSLFAAAAGSYPAKTTLAGTEKVYLDDSGADKSATISAVWKGMILTGGLTASGSTSFDFSGSTGTFKTSTGVNTFGGTTHSFAGKLWPATDDGAALGDTTHNFSDLFLATGAVLNFNNGNVVVTHSSGILTVGTGDVRITTAGTNSASVVTVGGTQTLTGKTLTSPTLTTPTLGVATATSLNGLTITSSTGTLTITNGKTLTANNTLVFGGTDSTTMTFPSASGRVITSSLSTNAVDAANSVWGASNAIVLEGATANGFETSVTPADPTADQTVTLADASGTVMLSSLSTNAPDVANGVSGASNKLVFEGATADAFETFVTVTDPTADQTITLPNATGTVVVSQASATTALTADNQAVTPGSSFTLQLTSDNATAANRTFTLSATGAITGARYTIIAPASNACELADTGIQKLSTAWSPGAYDTLTLLFDGTNFLEVGRSDN